MIHLWTTQKSKILYWELLDFLRNNGEDESNEIADIDEEEGEDSFLSSTEGDTGFLNTDSNSSLILEVIFTGSLLKTVVDEELPVSLMRFFKLFFSSPSFSNFYHEKRGDMGTQNSKYPYICQIFRLRNGKLTQLLAQQDKFYVSISLNKLNK